MPDPIGEYLGVVDEIVLHTVSLRKGRATAQHHVVARQLRRDADLDVFAEATREERGV